MSTTQYHRTLPAQRATTGDHYSWASELVLPDGPQTSLSQRPMEPAVRKELLESIVAFGGGQNARFYYDQSEITVIQSPGDGPFICIERIHPTNFLRAFYYSKDGSFDPGMSAEWDDSLHRGADSSQSEPHWFRSATDPRGPNEERGDAALLACNATNWRAGSDLCFIGEPIALGPRFRVSTISALCLDEQSNSGAVDISRWGTHFVFSDESIFLHQQRLGLEAEPSGFVHMVEGSWVMTPSGGIDGDSVSLDRALLILSTIKGIERAQEQAVSASQTLDQFFADM